MKNKKGFTLIELVATIIILCALFLIVTPIVINIMKDQEKDIDEALFTIIENAAELYISDNKNLYPQLEYSNEIVDISIRQLVDKGLLIEPVKNPNSNKEIPLNAYIRATVKQNKTLKYSYLGEVEDTIWPKMFSKFGTERCITDITSYDYVDGIIAYDNVDGDLKHKVTYQTESNTPNQYIITYKVQDSADNEQEFIFNLIVSDTCN